MPRGGARTNSGPAPDPNALKRQRDGREWVKLAPDGRAGKPTPPWPLPEVVTEAVMIEQAEERIEQWQFQASSASGRALAALEKKIDAALAELAVARARRDARIEQESALWEHLWTMPQAVVWEADHAELQVALYVRAQLEAMEPYAAANARTLARQYADALLLTIPAMHSMHYVIDNRISGASSADLVGEQAAQARPVRPSRFRVVRDDETEESS